jgi:hypothetical protein
MGSERERIALQLRCIVEPYRDPLLQGDALNLNGYRVRASRLLDGLDDAVAPYPDLKASLADARAELGLS